MLLLQYDVISCPKLMPSSTRQKTSHMNKRDYISKDPNCEPDMLTTLLFVECISSKGDVVPKFDFASFYRVWQTFLFFFSVEKILARLALSLWFTSICNYSGNWMCTFTMIISLWMETPAPCLPGQPPPPTKNIMDIPNPQYMFSWPTLVMKFREC